MWIDTGNGRGSVPVPYLVPVQEAAPDADLARVRVPELDTDRYR